MTLGSKNTQFQFFQSHFRGEDTEKFPWEVNKDRKCWSLEPPLQFIWPENHTNLSFPFADWHMALPPEGALILL